VSEKLAAGHFAYQIPESYPGKDGAPEPSGMSGVIVLKKPTIVERFDYMERCGFDLDGQGQMQAAGNKLKTTIKLVELSLPHYVSVAIKKDDGTEIGSVEEMMTDGDFDRLLCEVGGLLLNGFRPSKK
jgi:hypothetical protein